MINNTTINKRKTFFQPPKRIPRNLLRYQNAMSALYSYDGTKDDKKLITFVSRLLLRRFKLGVAAPEQEEERIDK